MTFETTTLEFLLSALHCDDAQDLFQRSQTASADELEGVLEQYRAWVKSRPVAGPDLSDGHYRPYFPTDSRGANWLHGINAGTNAFGDYEQIWRAVDTIKHRLLYCHSVAIDDPTRLLLALAAADHFDSRRHRAYLGNFIQFLSHLQPLTKAGVLVLVDGLHHGLNWPINKTVDDRVQRILPLSEYNRPSNEEVAQIFRRAPPDVRDRALANMQNGGARRNLTEQGTFINARFQLKAALTTLVYFSRQLTPYLPSNYDVRLLGQLVDALAHNASAVPGLGELDTYRDRLVEHLVDVELPAVKSLTVDDIVAIRGGNQFAHWRGHLSAALRQACAIPQNTPNRSTVMRNTVREVLRHARTELDEEFKQSSTLAALQAGTTSMVGGTVSALITLALDPSGTLLSLKTGLAAAAGSAGVASVARYRSSHDLVAVRNHFVAVLD